ncbi:DUF746 domain-containing protein [Cupriavidus basilensis]|uniref:DUF746 domain-containing protein n=1 Tax=Cupriavidus basilensis TaxID=68895 RepID=A0ABT6AME3_9BURK|nr:DUF746 domain-containing protein [Cupriavidus basilensis]MDF3833797.1 DUF746 domain-containing protein [Cupriavidus basilensis]
MHVRPLGPGDAGDADLAAFLLSAWRKLHSASHRPPRCPRCDARGATCDGLDHSRLPQFHCHGCNRRFNRLTGTPMARLRPEDKLRAFFTLISLPASAAEVGRKLEIQPETVAHWSLQIRLWLLALDPEGSWESRVQLGVRYAVVPASVRDAPAKAAFGCRCTLVGSDSPSLSQADDGPLLMRVCPLCERAAHSA